MSDPCPHCGQPMPVDVRKHSPGEAAARALAKRTGSSIPFCRKAVVALKEAGWSITKIMQAIEEQSEPGQAPWEFTKQVTTRPWKKEPEAPPPLPPLEEMAIAAGFDNVQQWAEYHKISPSRMKEMGL